MKKNIEFAGQAWNPQTGTFHLMPNEIYRDSRLTFSDVKVYAGIAMHYNQKTKISWPSISKIAEETGIDERTVRRSIKKLEETGWIEVCGDVCKKEQGLKTRTVNYYRLLEPPTRGVQAPSSITPAVTASTPGGGLQVTRRGPTGHKLGVARSQTRGVQAPLIYKNKNEQTREQTRVTEPSVSSSAPDDDYDSLIASKPKFVPIPQAKQPTMLNKPDDDEPSPVRPIFVNPLKRKQSLD